MASMLRLVQARNGGHFGRLFKVPLRGSPADWAEEVGASTLEAEPKVLRISSSQEILVIGCDDISVSADQDCAGKEEINVTVSTASGGVSDGPTPNEDSALLTAGRAPLAVAESLSDHGGDDEAKTTAQKQSGVEDCTDDIGKSCLDDDGKCDGDTIENSPIQMRFLTNNMAKKSRE